MPLAPGAKLYVHFGSAPSYDAARRAYGAAVRRVSTEGRDWSGVGGEVGRYRFRVVETPGPPGHSRSRILFGGDHVRSPPSIAPTERTLQAYLDSLDLRCPASRAKHAGWLRDHHLERLFRARPRRSSALTSYPTWERQRWCIVTGVVRSAAALPPRRVSRYFSKAAIRARLSAPCVGTPSRGGNADIPAEALRRRPRVVPLGARRERRRAMRERGMRRVEARAAAVSRDATCLAVDRDPFEEPDVRLIVRQEERDADARWNGLRSTMRIGSFPTGRRRCSRRRTCTRIRSTSSSPRWRSRCEEELSGELTAWRVVDGERYLFNGAPNSKAPCRTMRRSLGFPMHPTIWRDGMASCAAPGPCSRVATPASRRSPHVRHAAERGGGGLNRGRGTQEIANDDRHLEKSLERRIRPGACRSSRRGETRASKD